MPAKKKHNTIISAEFAESREKKHNTLILASGAKKKHNTSTAAGAPKSREKNIHVRACHRCAKAKNGDKTQEYGMLQAHQGKKNIGFLRNWRAAGAPRQKYKRKMGISRAAGAPK